MFDVANEKKKSVIHNINADKSTMKEQLRDLCAEELPEYAQPEDFIVIDKMPLTAIGKVDYKALETCE